MIRRNFIKSTISLSGIMAVEPLWLAKNNKIRFGYYYPATQTPEFFKKFETLFKKVGIETEVHNLMNLDATNVLQKIQSGYFAGVFISTNLLAEQIPLLYLLADGPDLQNDQQLQQWYLENEGNWNEALGSLQLKRLPFVTLGQRRGFWHKPEMQQFNLQNKLVYGDGLWKEMFKKLGARVSNKKSSQNEVDFFITSNLFFAQEMNIPQSCNFVSNDTVLNNNSTSGQVDLYFNNSYWQTLNTSSKTEIVSLLSEVKKVFTHYVESQDQTVMSQIKEQSKQMSDQIGLAFNAKFARDVRLESVMSTSLGQTGTNLLESFNTEFALSKRS